MKCFKYIISFIAVMLFLNSNAQTVNWYQGMDLARRGQLAGQWDTSLSLCVNPITLPVSFFDSTNTKYNKIFFFHKKSNITFLPLSLTQQYNSTLPYDWNAGPMIPSRGYQLVASTGFSAQFGKHLSLQLAPEFVYAGNDDFETFMTVNFDRLWERYYHWLNNSDIPEKFGSSLYTRFFPGQSSIRYNTKNMSFGISTENMWWGPGVRNALIMSNNAPGFLHVTINTIRPIHSKIGSFEGQIIGGRLDDSGIPPPETNRVNNGIFLYHPKRDEWRYITGMVLSWQPKWVSHLFVGITKAAYLYPSDISSPLDILPFDGFFGPAVTPSEKTGKKASQGALFFRYILPKEQVELYMEYGRSDQSLMPWNIVESHPYRRAYVAGFKKIFDAAQSSHIQLAVEFTQLEAPDGSLIQAPGESWYTHDYVRQGYTQMGRVIGAGIGPGGNSQTLEISWFKGYKKIGLQFERVVHNEDFYLYAFEDIPDYSRQWIDLSTTLHTEWNFKRFLFSSDLGLIRAYNHEWWAVYGVTTFTGGYDYLNFHGKLSLVYRW